MKRRFAAPVLALVALLSSVVLVALSRPVFVAGSTAHAGDSMHLHMTDAAMKAESDAWWATHARVGTSSVQTPAATFTVNNDFFDHDGNPATQVDTAQIMVGQSVLWQWVAGSHTVTNGTGSADPSAGTLFDQASNTTSRQFNFAFNTAGTFPFFCRFHEFLNMKGVVIVATNTGVAPPLGRSLGFTMAPAPNPSRRGVTFAFAMREAGRARAEVFDAGGRRVALVIDGDLPAGSHAAAWDGRVPGGGPAGPGAYYLRLQLPGYASSRTIVIAR